MWSGPTMDLDNVKCRSIIFAPNAIAEWETNNPNVWSDNPTGTLKVLRRVSIAAKFISSSGAGYEELQWSKIIFGFPDLRITLIASSILDSVLMPVDKIRGLDVTIVTSSKNKNGTLELLKEFNFPIDNKKNWGIDGKN